MSPYRTAELLDVENNFAWLPHHRVLDNGQASALLTFCNCYISAWLAARGVFLEADKANKQFLQLVGHPDEWREVSRAEALSLVNTDPTSTVVAIATDTEHGHVAGCVESPASDPVNLYVTAAGARNFKRVKLEASFGFLKPRFFLFIGKAAP